jgi:phage baseplate assembly protein V
MRSPQDAPTDPDKLIRLGTIDSVDLATGTCVVKLDTGALTGSIKWAEARSGATRTWNPPSVGEQVKLDCPGGEIGAAIVSASVPSIANPPAGTTAAPLIKFADGAVVSYDPHAHALTITLPAGATLAVNAPGGTTITGALAITGDVTVTGTITGQTDVIAGTISGKTHKHTGVATGGGVSGTPQ